MRERLPSGFRLGNMACPSSLLLSWGLWEGTLQDLVGVAVCGERLGGVCLS